jgi:hypothetical protein
VAERADDAAVRARAVRETDGRGPEVDGHGLASLCQTWTFKLVSYMDNRSLLGILSPHTPLPLFAVDVPPTNHVKHAVPAENKPCVTYCAG